MGTWRLLAKALRLLLGSTIAFSGSTAGGGHHHTVHYPVPTPRPVQPGHGLPWRSGASSGTLHGFDSYRDRRSTVTSIWPSSQTWWQLAHPDQPADLAHYTRAVTIGMPMFPSAEHTSFHSCATGGYDDHFATMGRSLVREGRSDAFLRLGWEFNGDWYSWSAANASPATWTACWRHEVSAVRSTDPAIRIVWDGNQGSASAIRGRMLRYYPGDAYVDVVGVDYYDAWPSTPNAAAWRAHYLQTEPDGAPYGLGAWLAFARAHGKKLAVPEWAVTTQSGGGGDDPYFISRMYDFFRTHARHIAFECYFDDEVDESISGWTGHTRLPHAARRYRRLFGQ